ncbi:MAG: hypothetical protein LBK53_04400 [Heliobacteriaceae bacterium]|nr:hypothetical protein [Heliobacteriaceae bacterium]
MGFFNSLSEIAKNRSNFRKWEEEQRDNRAQREALYQKRPHSDAEIKHAQQLGTTIIDVVDIMDNHSESIAENVETATAPLSSFATYATFIGSSLLTGKFLINPAYKARHKIAEEQIYRNQAAEKLARQINEAAGGGRSFYASDFKKKKVIDRIQDPELKSQAKAIYDKYTKSISKYKNRPKYGFIGIALATLAAYIGTTIFATKLQVDSSKIARFQARKILEDPKAFVKYTPEQIEAAKKELENNPELKKKKRKEKLNTGFFKGIINVLKDRKAYKEAKRNDTDESKKVTRALTPEERVLAQKDKEIIQRTIRIVNNEAEKYSQKMEMTAGLIMGGTPILGALAGLIINKIDSAGGFVEKYVNKAVDKHGSEEAKKAFAEFKTKKPGSPGYFTKWVKFQKELLHEGKEGAKESRNFFKIIKKYSVAGLAHSRGKKWIFAGASAIISGFASLVIGLKLQKASARAGRYTAKRELEKDPRNFIGYSDEDFQEVKDVKGQKKKSGSKFKEWTLFIPTVMKQYYEYQKFKKNEYKENKILQEELMKQEVTAEQLTDAKNLQRKLFNTFEKVDDNSQQYSESTEAAIEIVKPFVYIGGGALALSPIIYTAVQLKKGKTTIINKITGRLSKASKFLKSKIFKNYLKDVEKNIPYKVQGMDAKSKPLGTLLKNVNFKEDTIPEASQKVYQNLLGASADFRKLDNEAQKQALDNLAESINSITKNFKLKGHDAGSVVRRLGHCDNPQTRADVLDILLNNTKVLTEMTLDRRDAAIEFIERYDGGKLINFSENFPEILQELSKLDKKDFPHKIADIFSNPEAITEQQLKQFGLEANPLRKISVDGAKEALKSFKEKVGKMSDAEVEVEMMKYGRLLSGMDKKTVLDIIPKVEKIIDNIPEAELKAIFNKFIQEFSEHPDEALQLLMSGKIQQIFMTPKLKAAIAAAGVSWTVFIFGLTGIIGVWLSELQLKAGRLGVMKAIESLGDPAYYANIEIQEERQQAPQTSQTPPQKSSSLLDKFRRR